MTLSPNFKRITPDELDKVLACMHKDKCTELFLFGPEIKPNHFSKNWSVKWQGRRIFYLTQYVNDLASRLTSLSQLTLLCLLGNKIGDTGVQALEALSQLTSLNLGSNEIGDTGAQALAFLPQLTSLNLNHNKIGDTGIQALTFLPQLTSLYLRYNKIGNIEVQTLSTLTQLTSLNLGHNEIDDTGVQALEALPQLTSLNLEFNKIGDTGAQAFAALTQLTSLNLRGNKIGKTGVQAIAALPQLASLNLNYNKIGNAGTQALAALLQLTSLDLRNNKIGDTGAQALAALPKLTSLDLRNNKIGDVGVQALAALTKLTSLNLGNNKISDTGVQALTVLTKLTSLNLGDNKIGDTGIQILTYLTQLNSLYLEETEVTDLAPLINLSKLRILNITRTEVTELSPLINLFRTRVPIILEPYEFHNGFKVGVKDGVYVDDCPLVHPLAEVVKQGHEAVLNYFQEIEAQGVDQLFEAKVLIVGEGGAGKTSLVRRLYQTQQDLPSEDETTKGIDVHQHEFTGSNERPFRLNVWDFGGQQIYHATHQFFLTKNSLYILVDDTRKDSKSIHDLGFKYWLEVIETLSERSPILIFQNEKGGRSKTIDEAGIKGRFPNVKAVYGGNLAETDSANRLRSAIEHFAGELPHIGEEVPAQWPKIRNALEQRAQEPPYISQQDYFDIYAEHLDFNRVKALHLSGYLHELGVFLHFKKDRRLRKTVILQNSWATDAVFRILDDETVKTRLGRFTLTNCERVWATSDYANKHNELLALMEKFELCYLLLDSHPETWLAPQLLSPVTPPELNAWAEPGDLVRSYRYEFLPKGLVNRLMVRMHRFIKHPELAWTAGALFEHETTQVLVKTMDRGNEIMLRAKGPERKELLTVIASDLDVLNASFHGLEHKVSQWIPCICNQCANAVSPDIIRAKTLT